MFFRAAGGQRVFFGRAESRSYAAAKRILAQVGQTEAGMRYLRAVFASGRVGVAISLESEAEVIDSLAGAVARGELVLVAPRPMDAPVTPPPVEEEPLLPLEPSPAEEKKPDEWLEIVLVEENGRPVAGAAYRVELANGTVIEGYLNGEGKARVEGIAKGGNAKVTFPELDEKEWEAR